MKRAVLVFSLLIGGCSDQSYSKAVQNQMLNADDAQRADIARLQRDVSLLQRRLFDESEKRAKDDAELNHLIALVDNVIKANRKVDEAEWRSLKPR